jgi:hypothetical protein
VVNKYKVQQEMKSLRLRWLTYIIKWRKRVLGSRNYFIPFQPQMHKIGNSKLRITIQLV